MDLRTNLSYILVFCLAFAGCTGGDGDTQSAPTMDGSPSFDDTTGAIHGVVTNEEGVPLVGASVGLVETGVTTSTLETGEFALNNISPGTYTIQATAVGYETTADSIEVVVGEVSEKTFSLPALESEVGYPATHIQDGVLACSFRAYPGVPLWVPDEDQPTNTSRGALAPGWYTGVAVCGLDGVNRTTGDKFLIDWHTANGVREVTLEMKWTTNQALGKGLSVTLEDPEGINNGRPTYGADTGTSPLRIDANETKVLNVTTANERDCIEDVCEFTTRVFAEANTTEYYTPAEPPPVGPYGKPRHKIDAGVVLNQRFTQYLTTFHRQSMPEGFTAIADE